MPTFVTSDVQMVIEVKFAAGDTFQIGYKSVAEKVGPRIPRTKAQTSTLSPPRVPLDQNAPSGRIPDGYKKVFGYRQTNHNPFIPVYDYGYSQTPQPFPPGIESPALSGRTQAHLNRQTSSNEYPGKQPNEEASSSRENENTESKEKIIESNSKNRKNSVMVGLLWAFAIIFTISGTSALVYFKYKDKIDAVRHRTVQRLEAKL